MPTTIRIPLELVTVQLTSANAFWTAKTGTTIDMGYVAYLDGGEGISTWQTPIPSNVAVTPAWNLDYKHVANTSGGGNVMLTAQVRAVNDGEELDGAYTLVSSAATFVVAVANTLNIDASSGGNFDSVAGVAADDVLLVRITRHGGNASDTLGVQWNLWYPLLKIDVT